MGGNSGAPIDVLHKRKTRGPSPEKTRRTLQAIFQAAMSEFLEKGFAAATIEGVARRASVAKGTLYRYFANKEAMFEGVARELVALTRLKLEQNVRLEGETVESYLRRTLLPAIRDIERSGRARFARIVMSEGRAFPLLVQIYRQEVHDPLVEQIRVLAAEAYASGELPNDSLVRYPQLLLGPNWLGMIHNGFTQDDQQLDIGEMFEAHLNMIFRSRTVGHAVSE